MNEITKELTNALSNLVQLDIDAVHAYNQAAKEIEDPIIKERLLKFQDDHRSHISGLSEEMRGFLYDQVHPAINAGEFKI